jgi:hypothetical protein
MIADHVSTSELPTSGGSKADQLVGWLSIACYLVLIGVSLSRVFGSWIDPTIKVVASAESCTPGKTSWKEGTVTFDFTNKADISGGLYVVRGAMGDERTRTRAPGGPLIEGAIVGVGAGRSASLDLPMDAGTYTLVCWTAPDRRTPSQTVTVDQRPVRSGSDDFPSPA